MLLSDLALTPAGLLEALGEAVIAVDLQGRVIAWNPAAEALYGWTASEALGQRLSTLLVPAVSAEQGREIIALLHAGRSWSGDFEVRRKDGTVLPVHVTDTPIRDATGLLVGVIGVSRDITEQKQAEARLRESEERLRRAMEIAGIGAWDWDAGTNTVEWAEEAERLLGLEPRTFGGTVADFEALVHPDDRDLVRAAVDQALSTGEDYRAEFRSLCPDGSMHWFDSSARVELDEAGRPLRMIGVMRDVTERKLAEVALCQREQEFRALVENAADVIARFGRDLRLTYVNPAAERAIGRAAAELLNHTCNVPGVSPEVATRLELTIRQVFQTGREQTLELPIGPVGEERQHQARLTPELGLDGTVKSVLCIARDVSERRHVEQEQVRLYRELMDREERLQEMVREILLGQGAQRRHEQTTVQIESLTAREREILRLIAEGQTNQQVGRVLGLSAGTVRNHISRLLPKLGAVDRTQAVARAYKFGLIERD